MPYMQSRNYQTHKSLHVIVDVTNVKNRILSCFLILIKKINSFFFFILHIHLNCLLTNCEMSGKRNGVAVRVSSPEIKRVGTNAKTKEIIAIEECINTLKKWKKEGQKSIRVGPYSFIKFSSIPRFNSILFDNFDVACNSMRAGALMYEKVRLNDMVGNSDEKGAQMLLWLYNQSNCPTMDELIVTFEVILKEEELKISNALGKAEREIMRWLTVDPHISPLCDIPTPIFNADVSRFFGPPAPKPISIFEHRSEKQIEDCIAALTKLKERGQYDLKNGPENILNIRKIPGLASILADNFDVVASNITAGPKMREEILPGQLFFNSSDKGYRMLMWMCDTRDCPTMTELIKVLKIILMAKNATWSNATKKNQYMGSVASAMPEYNILSPQNELDNLKFVGDLEKYMQPEICISILNQWKTEGQKSLHDGPKGVLDFIRIPYLAPMFGEHYLVLLNHPAFTALLQSKPDIVARNTNFRDLGVSILSCLDDHATSPKIEDFIKVLEAIQNERGMKIGLQKTSEIKKETANVNIVTKQEDSKPEEDVKKDKRDCVICMNADWDTVFMDCSHLCCCSQCAYQVTECPICKAKIVKRLKIFTAS